MKYKKKILFVKIEDSYGVDSKPEDTAKNAVQTHNLDIDPYKGNTVSMELDDDTFGSDAQINTGPNAGLTFDVYLAGSGAKGIAPAWGPLLRACGFDETIVEGTSVAYQPVSESFESLTAVYIQDGQFHKITGAYGNVSLDFQSGSLPVASFQVIGSYGKPVALSKVADTTAFKNPIPVTNANTPTFKIGDYSAICKGFRFDMGNDTKYRNLMGVEGAVISDRAPAGKVTIEAPSLATKDFYDLVESHNGITYSTVQLIHGTTDGNIIAVDMPNVQLSSIAHEDLEGMLAYAMDILILKKDAAGDDEIVITLT